MYRLATLTTLALAFFLTALPSLAQVARFEVLELGEAMETVVYDVSSDGSTVMGMLYGGANGGLAFRWQDGETVALPDVPSSEADIARASSTDGSVVVGGKYPSGVAARWQNGEVRVIQDPEECLTSTASDVSGDGSIVVGDCRRDETHNGSNVKEAIRWVDGEMEGLGWLPVPDPEELVSRALAISSDGSTIVGDARPEPAGNKAFRWTEEAGMEELCSQEWCKIAIATSADGSVIVGDNNEVFAPANAVSWRWKEGVGAEQLPLPEDWVGGMYVKDVSADGSIVIGWGLDEEGEVAAYIWTEEAGSRDLWEVLEDDFSLDMTDWRPWLGGPSGISDDGTVIVGNIYNPHTPGDSVRAFRAEAPFGQPIADEATPEALADVLSAPSPNPVHGTSTFTVAVERGQHVAVEVFDALGRQVQTVYNDALAAGMSERLTLDASALPAGVYIVRATGEDFAKTRRVTVVR